MSNPVHVAVWLKALLSGGLAAYLTLFVVNNLTDRETNSVAIVRMMSMRELKGDPDGLGAGVTWRAIDAAVVHRLALYAVVVVQVIAAALLWRAAVMFVLTALGGYGAAAVRHAVAAADLGLIPFMGLWLAMIIGGLWFSYWVKMGPVLQGHMGMLTCALLSVLVINL